MNRTYTTPMQAAGIWCCLAVFVAGSIAISITSGSVRVPVAAVVMGIPGLFFGIRAALSRIETAERGIKIVNPASTRFIDWEEIRKFSIGRHGFFPAVCLVEKNDGTIHHAFGIQAPNPAFVSRRSSAHVVVDALNDQLTRAKDEEPPTRA